MTEACPICRSSEKSLIFVKDGGNHFRCSSCKMIYATPLHNGNLEQNLENFEPAFLQYLGPSVEDKPNFERTIRWMTQHGLRPASKILDVGCGSGKWVRHLRQQGHLAIGIEPSRPLFDHFLSTDKDFYLCDLSTVRQVPENSLDAITMFDVIEHVNNPLENFKEAAKYLKPGGLFFVSTPDAGCLFARTLGKKWHHYCRYHLSLFSKEHLLQSGNATGFKLIAGDHLPRYRSLGYTVRYLFNFAIRRKSPKIPSFLDRMFWRMNLGDIISCCFQKR